MDSQWNHKIFGIQKAGFEELALEIFRFQYENNAVYRQFADAICKTPSVVDKTEFIPFLPVSFFKSHKVVTTKFVAEAVFESSGTSATINSNHFVKSTALYEASFLSTFKQIYGHPENWCILGLLPSYLERGNSSLVYMVNKLINLSGHPQSGFYLYDFFNLAEVISKLEKNGQKTLLIGVTYALLDFAELFPMPFKHTVVMETGGMKGRREDLLREEVHQRLKSAFGVEKVNSEYGMTELLSQAYSKGEGIFSCPPWMKILIRDDEDPLTVKQQGSGVINVIDLANIWSCAFIATDDAGKIYADGSFEVLGRTDGSDMRGCSLLTL